MYATNYFETMILNVLNGVQAGAPATVYVGLFLTNPGEAGGGTEISYTGYARQAITFDAPESMEDGIGIKNSAEITFPLRSGEIVSLSSPLPTDLEALLK